MRPFGFARPRCAARRGLVDSRPMQRERDHAREMLPGDLASALRAPLEGRRRAAAADPPGAASAALAVALALSLIHI